MNVDIKKLETLNNLRVIPGVGKSISEDLWKLGIRKVSDLKNKNPMRLYQNLNVISGVRNDICLLYTFRCAVYFAAEKKHNKAKLNWWYWKGKTYNE
jgi:hypothetical protein